jgi:hypothetical protein
MIPRFLCLASLLFSPLVLQSAAWGEAPAKLPVAELLSRCAKAISITPVAMKIWVDHRSPVEKKIILYDYREDGNRIEWIAREGKDADKPDYAGSIGYQMMDGEHIYDFNTRVGIAPNHIGMNKSDMPRMTYLTRYNEDMGQCLSGRLSGFGDTSIIDVLQRSQPHLRDQREMAGGYTCDVVEAQTRFGSVRAWIAPDAGYNLMQYVVERKASDHRVSFQKDELVSSIEYHDAHFQSITQELHSVTLGTVGDRLIPIGGTATTTSHLSNGEVFVNKSIIRRSEVHLPPDFVAMNAFTLPGIPDGTPVYGDESLPQPGAQKYEWRDGRAQPVIEDELGDALNQRLSPSQSTDSVTPQIVAERRAHLWPWLLILSAIILATAGAWAILMLRRRTTQE